MIRARQNSGPATSPTVYLEGTIPGLPNGEFTIMRSRIFLVIEDLAKRHQLGPFALMLGIRDANGVSRAASPNEVAAGDLAADARQVPKTQDANGGARPATFSAVEPFYDLSQVILPEATKEQLLDCISFVEVSPQVFDEWGLRRIEPHPSLAVNFRGPPGTGKTMAAHAAAKYLGRKILFSRLSDLESKYHGEGPKNLVRLFQSAKEEDAVLFVDEAESLLSRRFAQPEQAAESALNSMRTELLMALDSFDGLVIFASNLPHSYDVAVESRLIHVDFELPDHVAREAIWHAHLVPALPRAEDVDVPSLAAIDGVSGRDIKFAVISAAVSAARRKTPTVSGEALRSALEMRREARRRESVTDSTTKPNIDSATRERIVSAAARATTVTMPPADD